MHTPTILTDDRAQHWRYTPYGLTRVSTSDMVSEVHPTYSKREKPEDVPQPWHYRLFSALINASLRCRW